MALFKKRKKKAKKPVEDHREQDVIDVDMAEAPSEAETSSTIVPPPIPPQHGTVDPQPAIPPAIYPAGSIQPKVALPWSYGDPNTGVPKQSYVQPCTTPAPIDVSAIMAQLQAARDELVGRVTAIETMLGFVATADDLTVRVAKIELFLGIKAA